MMTIMIIKAVVSTSVGSIVSISPIFCSPDGPGDMPVLFPDTSPLSATVGGSVSVQCSAECSPQCTYTWTK